MDNSPKSANKSFIPNALHKPVHLCKTCGYPVHSLWISRHIYLFYRKQRIYPHFIHRISAGYQQHIHKQISKQTARFRRRIGCAACSPCTGSRERPSESGSEGPPTGPNGVVGFRGAQWRRHGAGEAHEVRRRSAIPLCQGARSVAGVHVGGRTKCAPRCVYLGVCGCVWVVSEYSLPPTLFF